MSSPGRLLSCFPALLGLVAFSVSRAEEPTLHPQARLVRVEELFERRRARVGGDPGREGEQSRALLEEAHRSMAEGRGLRVDSAAMTRAGGNASEAARLLGEKPDTLRARLRRSRR